MLKEVGHYDNKLTKDRREIYIFWRKVFSKYKPLVDIIDELKKHAKSNDLPEELEDAIELIKEKKKADAPIYTYKQLPVIKGKGRFGPFIKWNNTFINVNKKYDWDNLSDKDIEELIEDKIQKDKDKLIHHWEADGIKVEKARWGRHTVTKGKTKVELDKSVDVSKMTLEEAIALIDSKAPKKKTTKKATKKKATPKKK